MLTDGRHVQYARRLRGVCAAAVLACLALSASAAEPWLAPGDLRLRHDLTLLVDTGVIELPISAWPIARADLARALAAMDSARSLSPAQALALQRVRARAEDASGLEYGLGAAARPMQLRSFADTPREEGELQLAYRGGEARFGGRLELTAVVDADDGDTLRLDGSYLSGRLGNWLLTAGAQDRWWGSGWEGSLLLSTSARPVPALSLDRAQSLPFESRWLRWIGPWRMSTFMGYMEGGRQDYDHPLLFGLRVSARPLDGLEISLERSAQWCGEGRSCDLGDFWNLWWGNDNAGENVDAADEPGNQLAGWDIRWASPIGEAPYALYFQHTGETIDNKIPRPYRSLELMGLEVWNEFAAGGSWRGSLEWANTRCGGTEDGQKLWDCAYNSNIYDVEGYRSRGRPIGHAMDGDGEMLSLRITLLPGGEDSWTVLARNTRVNGGGGEPDTRHSIAPGPEDWWSLDLAYRRPLAGGWLELAAGADWRDREWQDTESVLPRASLQWRSGF